MYHPTYSLCLVSVGMQEGAAAASKSAFSLLADCTDGLAILAAIACALFFGRPRGVLLAARHLFGRSFPSDRTDLLNTGRALVGAGRGWLWASAALNALYLGSFYWSDPADGWPSVWHRRSAIAYSPWLTCALACVLFLPRGERMLQSKTATNRFLGGIDCLALLGLFACTLALYLSIAVYRAASLDGSVAAQTCLPPSFATVDLAFIGWAVAVVLVATWIALARGIEGWTRLTSSANTTRAALAGGVIASMFAQISNLNAIAVSGEQIMDAELQALGGQMLVPMLVAVVLAIALRLLRPRPGA